MRPGVRQPHSPPGGMASRSRKTTREYTWAKLRRRSPTPSALVGLSRPMPTDNNNKGNPITTRVPWRRSPASRMRQESCTRLVERERRAATAKLFQATVTAETRISSPVIQANRDPRPLELFPFARIAAGARGSIMTGNIYVPAWSRPDPPATLSRKCVRTVLSKELRFEGLVVTEAMDMGGITSLTPRRTPPSAPLRLGADDRANAPCYRRAL